MLLVVIGAVVLVAQTVSRATGARPSRSAAPPTSTRCARSTDEDVTRFGEELQRLDTELLTTELDEPTRQDYQRALDSYESAKESLARVTRPRRSGT